MVVKPIPNEFLISEPKVKIPVKILGPVWSSISNSHFHILNNNIHISPTRISRNYKQSFSNYSTKHLLNDQEFSKKST